MRKRIHFDFPFTEKNLEYAYLINFFESDTLKSDPLHTTAFIRHVAGKRSPFVCKLTSGRAAAKRHMVTPEELCVVLHKSLNKAV